MCPDTNNRYTIFPTSANCSTAGRSDATDVSSTTNTTKQAQGTCSSSRGLGKRGVPRGNEDGKPPRKRRREAKRHEQCGQCSIWIQSGSDTQINHLHPAANMQHPGSNAHALSQYATHAGCQFRLYSDSCICEPCYQDYRRNCMSENKENTIPRWLKVHTDYYTAQQWGTTKHCMFCCTSGSCHCFEIQYWGPETWYEDDDVITWRKFLSSNGYVPHDIPEQCKDVCRSHYCQVEDIIWNRRCATCSSAHTVVQHGS